jgi:hypothetical protein
MANKTSIVEKCLISPKKKSSRRKDIGKLPNVFPGFSPSLVVGDEAQGRVLEAARGRKGDVCPRCERAGIDALSRWDSFPSICILGAEISWEEAPLVASCDKFE